ncbi:MAG: PKD domain-containing protein [Chloroflexota bacterium]|nr:PKD domain-containing protein [Chloroflexota bacterium]
MTNLKRTLSGAACSLALAALCLALTVAPTFALTWTAQTSGTTNILLGVAYGGGQFVAVGASGTILTSPDGTTWTSQTSGTTQHIWSVVYGGSQFVAVGNSGTILTSPNGTTWTSRTSGSGASLKGIAYDGSQFVVAGSDGTILTSPNGTTWTSRTSGTTKHFNGAGYGGGQFVAVGNSGTILTSPNGTTWTSQTSGTEKYFMDVAYDGSQFVVVGLQGAILTSPNGTTWTSQTSGTWEDLCGVAYDGSQFVAVGSNGTIFTSPNGTTWTADTSGTPEHLRDVAYGGGLFVAVGNSGTILTDAGGSMLALTKSVTPTLAKPGDTITYTIAFSNTGAITATNVIITDTLSANITGASYSSSGVALTQVPGSRYVWTAPDLLQGDGGVITITGVLTKPLAAGTVPNTVTLAVSGTVQTANADLMVENVAPVADAGGDQSVSLNDTVTLHGSGSDDNGDALIYGWTQTGGSPSVTLDDPAAQQPTFTAPGAPTALTFTLTVTDTGALADTDEVVVTVANDADLAVTEDVLRSGIAITYTIVVQNNGPSAAGGAVVSSTFSSEVSGITWACVGSGGATCGSGGTLNLLLNDTLTAFPDGGVVTYTVRGTLGLLATGNNVVAVMPPSGVLDPDLSNNRAEYINYRCVLPLVFKNSAP